MTELAAPQACVPIGLAADHVGLQDTARVAWQRAADLGRSAGAMYNLGLLLTGEGDAEGARARYTRAADAGDPGAAEALAALLQEQGGDFEGPSRA
ncbi:hypothetical protein [Streptomyces sp. NPDC002671]